MKLSTGKTVAEYAKKLALALGKEPEINTTRPYLAVNAYSTGKQTRLYRLVEIDPLNDYAVSFPYGSTGRKPSELCSAIELAMTVLFEYKRSVEL